jgi:hypothetical protein
MNPEGDGTLENWAHRCAGCGRENERHWCDQRVTLRMSWGVVVALFIEALLVWTFMQAVWYRVHS